MERPGPLRVAQRAAVADLGEQHSATWVQVPEGEARQLGTEPIFARQFLSVARDKLWRSRRIACALLGTLQQ